MGRTARIARIAAASRIAITSRSAQVSRSAATSRAKTSRSAAAEETETTISAEIIEENTPEIRIIRIMKTSNTNTRPDEGFVPELAQPDEAKADFKEELTQSEKIKADLEEELVLPGEKVDDLQRSGLKIIQDPERFCFGMDAVLLTGFIQEGIGGRSMAGEDLLDLGTGTGIIPLLMSAKSDVNVLTGLEIQRDSARMAERSVRLNRLEDRIRIIQGDIKEADALFAPASFGVVTCNPPYMIGGHGLQNPDSPKAIARHEVLCDFEDVARAAERLLKPGGHFYLVHRPFRLAEIMTTLRDHKLEPKRMRLVYPYVDREPNMVLLDCVRGGRPRLSVEKPLIVYKEPGVYTEEIYEVYGY